MYSTEGFGRKSDEGTFEKITIQRNECGLDDVEFDILYCGICHTDVHISDNQMGSTQYPIIPGHELAGIATKVGNNVQGIKVGDHVGVGCISDSCMACPMCEGGEENYCEKGMTGTYNGQIKYGHIQTDTGYTYGGYSKRTTVHQRYIIKIPESYGLEYAGPIFCAGITMYSPLKHFGAGNGGKRVGIIGIGGLGQMAIKLAVGLGNEVTAISTNAEKESKVKEMGVKHFVLSTDHNSLKERAKTCDLLLNTISAPHQCAKYLSLLATNGTLVQLGLVTEPHNIFQPTLIFNRISVAGSLIGGMVETQDCIDFCAKMNIRPEIELVTADRLDEIHQLLRGKNDSIKRYVLDIKKSLEICARRKSGTKLVSKYQSEYHSFNSINDNFSKFKKHGKGVNLNKNQSFYAEGISLTLGEYVRSPSFGNGNPR